MASPPQSPSRAPQSCADSPPPPAQSARPDSPAATNSPDPFLRSSTHTQTQSPHPTSRPAPQPKPDPHPNRTPPWLPGPGHRSPSKEKSETTHAPATAQPAGPADL